MCGRHCTDLLMVAEFLKVDCLAPAGPTPSSGCSLQTLEIEGSFWLGWACCGASPLKSRANSLFAASGSNQEVKLFRLLKKKSMYLKVDRYRTNS